MSENLDYSSALVRGVLEAAGITERLSRPGVMDLAINRPGEIWLELDSGWEKEEVEALDYSLCYKLATALSSYNKQQLSTKSPIKTVELPDKERGLIVMPPACEDGTISITIRRPFDRRFTLEEWIETGKFGKTTAVSTGNIGLEDWEIKLKEFHLEKNWPEFFRLAIAKRLNIIIFGGTGSGKTTFAKTLVDLFPAHRRYITIEAINELKLPYHPNHVHLLYKEHISPKDLVSCSLRMKPDHIFLSEITGDEAWNFMELLNTGHPGTITTAHANGTLSGYARVAGMIKESPVGAGLDYSYIDRRVKTSFDVVLFMEKHHIMEVHYDPEVKNKLLNAA
jgi:type IV secretion system protein VirB11